MFGLFYNSFIQFNSDEVLKLYSMKAVIKLKFDKPEKKYLSYAAALNMKTRRKIRKNNINKKLNKKQILPMLNQTIYLSGFML